MRKKDISKELVIRLLTPMNDLSFAGRGKEQPAEKNLHKCYEVVCCRDGGYLVADGKIALSAGDVLIVPPFTRHTHGGGAGDLYLYIEKALLPLKGVAVISGADAERLTRECGQALEYFSLGKPRVAGAYGNLITALVADATSARAYSPVVEAIAESIESNLGAADYSLEAFMRTLPLNYDYLRKSFARETGATPHEYLVSARMARARTIILSGMKNRYSEYSVSQIAEMCGYAEPLYFSRVFKKYYGCSPSEYAEKNKNRG